MLEVYCQDAFATLKMRQAQCAFMDPPITSGLDTKA